MAKIDEVLQEGVLVDRAWLKQHGIEATAVDYYLRSNKIKAVAHGLYRKPGPPLKWQSILYSLTLLGFDAHIGHISGVRYHGYSHYLELGKPQSLKVCSNENLPLWVEKVETDQSLVTMKQNLFSESSIGIVEDSFGLWDWPIRYSSAERAFIELSSTIKTKEDVYQAKLMLEGAVNLRPTRLQLLLENCTSVKAKRVFLWLAKEVEHAWNKYIDISKINLGSGKRQIVPKGVLDTQFLITVPKIENEYY